MDEQRTYPSARELDELMREIRRYLATVDELRRQGHEPRWRAEEATS